PPAATRAMPCQRGLPSHAARSPATAKFAQSKRPDVTISTPTARAAARPGPVSVPSPAAKSGLATTSSPTQSASAPQARSNTGSVNHSAGCAHAQRRATAAINGQDRWSWAQARTAPARAARAGPPPGRPGRERAPLRTTTGATPRPPGWSHGRRGDRPGRGSRRGGARASRPALVPAWLSWARPALYRRTDDHYRHPHRADSAPGRRRARPALLHAVRGDGDVWTALGPERALRGGPSQTWHRGGGQARSHLSDLRRVLLHLPCRAAAGGGAPSPLPPPRPRPCP